MRGGSVRACVRGRLDCALQRTTDAHTPSAHHHQATKTQQQQHHDNISSKPDVPYISNSKACPGAGHRRKKGMGRSIFFLPAHFLGREGCARVIPVVVQARTQSAGIRREHRIQKKNHPWQLLHPCFGQRGNNQKRESQISGKTTTLSRLKVVCLYEGEENYPEWTF